VEDLYIVAFLGCDTFKGHIKSGFIIIGFISGLVLNKILLPYDKFVVKPDELVFERILRRRFSHLSAFSYY
jgi:hypothetical protein